ncbi:hypothetical protein MXB_719 [Myxobolus squamalis]|nr:hypothetical protein MXB_719 [Myxobolus squamalis]
MLPVFPSRTFPNHHSLSTGLYPESHGIVDNKMLLLNDNYSGFVSYFEKNSTNSFWWNFNTQLKPIFIANQLANKDHKSATIFWPGSDVSYNGHFTSKFEKKYDRNIKAFTRLERAVKYMQSKCYNLIMVYLDDFDYFSHRYGPDNFKSRIYSHEIFVDLNVTIITDGPVVGLYPQEFKNYDDLIVKSRDIVDKLNRVSKNRFTAYLKDKIPPKLHYSKNNRIPPVIIIMKNGTYFFEGKYFVEYFNCKFKMPGTHGWPVEDDQDMKALFAARGPSFKRNKMIDSIRVTDIYLISCHVLKITQICHPNNGSLETLKSVIE